MHLAFILAVVAATLNLTTAIAHFAISRAPGWKGWSRTFGLIALTATMYSLGNIVLCTAGWSSATYLAAARWNYFWAYAHVLLWFPFAFGGPDCELRRVPFPLRVVMVGVITITILLLVTGWHLLPSIRLIPVPWAGVVYRYVDVTPIGEAYGVLTLLLLSIPFVQFIRRMLAGERNMRILALGFAVFYVTAVVEVLVGNGRLVWLSPADIGFLAVVIPTSVRTLRRFIADAQRLRDLSERLEIEVRDRTQERDRAENALVESERLAALGRLAAGVGHEINNPLTYLQLSLTQVDDQLASVGATAEVRESLANAADGALRIQKVVEGLRTYSQRESARRAHDPVEIIGAALKVAVPHLRHVAHVETRFSSTPAVLADEPKLVQALVNLLVNAAQATGGREGTGQIAIRTTTSAEGAVIIEIQDDGPGIPAQHRSRLTEPYFTTRAADGGSGLGLFVTRGIVDAHGGRLEFEPVEPHGLCVRIILPGFKGSDADLAPSLIVQEPSVAGAVRDTTAPMLRVLVVDDEPLVLQVLTRALARNWKVSCAVNGEQALSELRRRDHDLVVCDLMMPQLSGMALAERIEAFSPALRQRMVFLTGGAVTQEAQEFLAKPGVVHLMKPIDLGALDAVLREVASRG